LSDLHTSLSSRSPVSSVISPPFPIDPDPADPTGNNLKNVSKTHGLSKKPIYKTWHGMMQRCSNPKNISYKYYGARGIKVCESWKKFENFYKDIFNNY
jgi:hypothetical protein